MTALKRYVRLEAVGLWREAPTAAPREVIVAFGKATLVLRDLDERPLGHWALAGVGTLGREDGATVFSMTAGGEETLAIRDHDMVAAIAEVSRADRRPPPAAGRPARRWGAPLIVLLALVALAAAAVAGPGLVREQAARILPAERAAEFGDRMLIALVAARGGTCATPAGQRALGRIAARLSPGRPPAVRVVDLGTAPAAALPGDTLLLGSSALAAAGRPEAVAGWIAVALGRDPVRDPAAGLMATAGGLATLAYVLTGRFDDAALARAAEGALVPPAPDEIPPAMARLAAAGIDARPFAAALGIAAPSAPRPAEPLLADQDWAALRAICG